MSTRWGQSARSLPRPAGNSSRGPTGRLATIGDRYCQPMLLVILGAGASYDSDRRRTANLRGKSLPLAQDLFSERFAGVASRYDAVQGILGDLRDAPNVEQVLAQLMADPCRSPHTVRPLP